MSGCIAIITSRWKSTRFEGKALALVNGKPLLQHIVDAVKPHVDKVIVATTISSNPIISYCAIHDIPCKAFPVEEDVFNRICIIQAYEQSKWILRVWGDQLIDDKPIKELINYTQKSDYDYTIAQPCFATVIKDTALSRAFLRMTPYDLYVFNEMNEHWWFQQYKFKVGFFKHKVPLIEINTPEDLERINGSQNA